MLELVILCHVALAIQGSQEIASEAKLHYTNNNKTEIWKYTHLGINDHFVRNQFIQLRPINPTRQPEIYLFI